MFITISKNFQKGGKKKKKKKGGPDCTSLMKWKTNLPLTYVGTEWGPTRITAGCPLRRSQLYFPFSLQPCEKRRTPNTQEPLLRHGAVAAALGAAGPFPGKGSGAGEEGCGQGPPPKAPPHLAPPASPPCAAVGRGKGTRVAAARCRGVAASVCREPEQDLRTARPTDGRVSRRAR